MTIESLTGASKLILPLIALTAGCGGGSGSNGGSASGSVAPSPGEAALLPAYEFAISDAGNEQQRLVLTSDFGSGIATDMSIDFRIEPLLGRYTLADRSLVFSEGAIAVETELGAMVVDITEQLEFQNGLATAPLAFAVDVGLFEGHVDISIIDGIVELRHNIDPPQTIQLTDFEQLPTDPLTLPVWRRQSAVAWAVLELLRELISIGADSFVLIQNDFESMSLSERECDAFPGTPPSGQLNRGMATLTWLGSGQISNGDRFSWDFTSCWLNSPEASGNLLNGRINLNGYSLRASPDGSAIRLAYESFDGLVGGLFFEDLQYAETIELITAETVTRPERSYVLSGGLRVVFSAP